MPYVITAFLWARITLKASAELALGPLAQSFESTLNQGPASGILWSIALPRIL